MVHSPFLEKADGFYAIRGLALYAPNGHGRRWTSAATAGRGPGVLTTPT